MMHDFLASFGELVDEWAERSTARMTKWTEQSLEERTEAAIDVIRKKPRRTAKRAKAT